MPLSQINKLLRVPQRTLRWTEMCNFVRPRLPETKFERPIFEGTVRRTEKRLTSEDYTKYGFVRARIKESRIQPEGFEFVVSKKTADALTQPFGYSSALHDLVLKDWDGSEQRRLEVIPQGIERHPERNAKTTDALTQPFGYSSALHDLVLKDWDGSEQRRLGVIPQGIERHPVTDSVTGLDFQVFDPDDKMPVLFPVMFERALYAYGVQMNKGIFQVENDRVWCHWQGPADKLPRFFRINCEQLDVGEKVHWEDIAKPKGLTLIDEKAPHVFCKIKSASEVEDMMKAGEEVEAAAPPPEAAAAKK